MGLKTCSKVVNTLDLLIFQVFWQQSVCHSNGLHFLRNVQHPSILANFSDVLLHIICNDHETANKGKHGFQYSKYAPIRYENKS